MAKISGFSLVRNGVKFEYPFLEAWRSLLPFVDELVLNVGKSEDQTYEVTKSFVNETAQSHPHVKIKMIETEWPLHDPEKKKTGLILSEQTNIALEACTHDWCFYIQADEVLHEDDTGIIQSAIEKATSTSECEAIVFQYQHFYGSYNVIQQTRSAYRREMRIIKKSSGARSVGDAQSFRKPSHGANSEKLQALLSQARIFHYGWVKTPEAMKEKTIFMDQLYHQNGTGNNYRYKRFWGLKEYQGTHPFVMKERISRMGWNWKLRDSRLVFAPRDVKKVILDLYEKITGHRPFEFKNYKVK